MSADSLPSTQNLKKSGSARSPTQIISSSTLLAATRHASFPEASVLLTDSANRPAVLLQVGDLALRAPPAASRNRIKEAQIRIELATR